MICVQTCISLWHPNFQAPPEFRGGHVGSDLHLSFVTRLFDGLGRINIFQCPKNISNNVTMVRKKRLNRWYYHNYNRSFSQIPWSKQQLTAFPHASISTFRASLLSWTLGAKPLAVEVEPSRHSTGAMGRDEPGSDHCARVPAPSSPTLQASWNGRRH